MAVTPHTTRLLGRRATRHLRLTSTSTATLAASWRAGVVRYDIDFTEQTVAYYGCNGEEYIEEYPLFGFEFASAPNLRTV